MAYLHKKKSHPELKVSMVDINETAVELAKDNSRLYGQDNIVLVSDGLSAVEGQFDIIVTNPPIRTGKDNIYRLFKEGFSHLKAQGKMYVVIRKKQGAESAVRYLGTLGKTEVIDRVKGYWILSDEKSVIDTEGLN